MLSATITAESASDTRWDAIVVGAGPAGSIAGYQLAKRGLRTLIVERKAFPRDKVCGACINGRAIGLLALVGLERVLADLGSIPLERFQVRCGRQRGEILLPAGVVVSRAGLDTELARAAVTAGADFLPQTSAVLDEKMSVHSERTVQLARQGQTISHASASIILLADGLGNPSLPAKHRLQSRVAKHSRIGLGGTVNHFPTELDRGTIYMAVGEVGYVGLVQLEDGRLNIAAALDPSALNRDRRPLTALTSIFQSAGFPELSSAEEINLTGTVPLTRRCHTPVDRRVLLLGDAAGYVEPFTGEGIACALTSGVAAANHVVQCLSNWNVESEREWCRQHRLLFDNRQRWCRRLARLLWHPWAVRGLLGGLAVAPWLARPIVGRLNERPAMSV